MFRGREQAHPERGRDLLQKLFEDLGGLAVIESAPLQEGRNMSMLLGPSKEVDKLVESQADEAEPSAPAAGDAADRGCEGLRPPRPTRRPALAEDYVGDPLRGAAVPEGRRLRGRRRRASSKACGIPAIAAGSRPSSVLVPALTVTGRSVLSRRVKQGMPR